MMSQGTIQSAGNNNEIDLPLTILFLLDSLFFCSRESYNHVSSWLADARGLANPDIVIIMVGNKIDRDADREVTFLEASRFSQENGWYPTDWSLFSDF